MNKISQISILDVVKKSIEDKNIHINFESSSLNIPTWDSLTQINIIVALDELLDGKVAEIYDLATATSVGEIIRLLRSNNLLQD